MNAKIADVAPIRGVEYDKSRPETRQPWLDQRRGGVTATEIRDAGQPAKRREIIQFKVTGQMEDLSHNVYVNHGNLREPMIAAWVESRFGITPCDAVYSHGENPRHLASPDGITLDPFTGELMYGAPGAAVSEIKTSKHDLHPGRLDAGRVLEQIDKSSQFARSNYYTQMQWQMYVMQAELTLFVWEQHNGIVDPETGTFSPIGVPEYAWVRRDQKLIDVLVEQVAPKLLADIDAARAGGMADGLPPAGDLPAEHAALIAEYFAGLDAEAIAKKRKEQAWKALQEIYLAKEEGEEFAPDQSIEIPGYAKLTVSTSSTVKPQFNEEGARKRAPKLFAQYEALVKRYTKPVPTSSQKLTITRPKAQ